jgi:hypothetical protein
MGQEPTTVTTSNDPDVIRDDIARTRGEMEGTVGAINDRVNPQRVYERRTGRMRSRWQRLRDSVMGSGDGSTTPDTEQARQKAGEAQERARRKAEGNPLAAGMIAFGVGALIGSALPETEAERQAAREATDKLDVEGTRQRLTERAQDVQQTVQQRGQEAAQDVKGTAQSAAQDVKEHGRQEGQRVQQDAKQSGQQVRQES